ncbi:MAG: TetR/AcrR family transcriptional regulator [Lachnospiraceae bacterium]|nr:TetR/AcrR family transcriptional regulator [Lachnospiraceae bacterium]
MGKIDLNKTQKKLSLLNTAFELFTTKGVNETSIAEIAKEAGIAKGTFYLYFRDKYDIRNKLISYKAGTLLIDAAEQVKLHGHTEQLSLPDRILALVDYIIKALQADKNLLMFISKNLSWGIFRESVQDSLQEEGDDNFKNAFYDLLSLTEENYKDPEIMIYLITEFVSSTCYNAILYSEPADMDTLKPYIFHTIRAIIEQHEPKASAE